MAKKGANQGEKGTFRKVSRDVREQRLRRRTGDVKRLEVVLVADSERDQYVASWMNVHLGRGEASEFTRLALEEKVAREVSPPPSETASEQIEALYTELAAQRRALTDEFATTPTVDYHEQRYNDLKADNAALRDEVEVLIGVVRDLAHAVQDLRDNPPQVTVQMAQAASVTVGKPDSLPEQPAHVQSSGLDMSRPRPRKALPAVKQPAIDEPPQELSDAEKIRLGKMMAASIAAFNGNNGGSQ